MECNNINTFKKFYNLLAGDILISTDFMEVHAMAFDDYLGNISSNVYVDVGSTYAGWIEASRDRDWFRVILNAGEAYQIRLNSAGSPSLADPFLRFRYGDGTLIKSDDDSGGGLNSLITYTPNQSGYYFIDVGDYSNGLGAYKFSVKKVDDYAGGVSTSGIVSVESTVSGQIETAGDHDWFKVNLDAGSTYQIRVNSSGSPGLTDPYLTLRYGDGGAIKSNDDGGGGRNALLTYTADQSGYYYLDVKNYDQGTGNYSLSVLKQNTDDYSATTSTAGTIVVNSSSTGKIDSQGDHDWFALNLTAGIHYQFKAVSTGPGQLSDPFLTLRSSSGLAINSDDDSGGRGIGAGGDSLLTFTPASSGRYYLDVSDFEQGTGKYTVSVNQIVNAPQPTPGYEIEVEYAGDPKYAFAFEQAGLKWETIIKGDLPDENSAAWGLIDDLKISATIIPIDGVGGILGQAAPDGLRASGNKLPFHGFMQFDSADMESMLINGTLGQVIEHEMGHVLGIGTLWEESGLASRTNSGQWIFTGPNAVAQYRILSSNQSKTYVPVESSTGSPGSDGAHWAESVFGTELMTPFAGGAGALSRLTAASLADLGYTVDISKADPYSMFANSVSLVGVDGVSNLTKTHVSDPILI